jgi:hypothetical protein
MPDVAFKKGMTPPLRQQHRPLTESGAKVVHPHRRRRAVKMAGSTNLATMVLSGIHRTTSAKGTTTMPQSHVRTKTTDGRATKAPPTFHRSTPGPTRGPATPRPQGAEPAPSRNGRGRPDVGPRRRGRSTTHPPATPGCPPARGCPPSLT